VEERPPPCGALAAVHLRRAEPGDRSVFLPPVGGEAEGLQPLPGPLLVIEPAADTHHPLGVGHGGDRVGRQGRQDMTGVVESQSQKVDVAGLHGRPVEGEDRAGGLTRHLGDRHRPRRGHGQVGVVGRQVEAEPVGDRGRDRRRGEEVAELAGGDAACRQRPYFVGRRVEVEGGLGE
jgi:hypothetical protein